MGLSKRKNPPSHSDLIEKKETSQERDMIIDLNLRCGNRSAVNKIFLMASLIFKEIAKLPIDTTV